MFLLSILLFIYLLTFNLEKIKYKKEKINKNIISSFHSHFKKDKEETVFRNNFKK